jgi:hypothetical protein
MKVYTLRTVSETHMGDNEYTTDSLAAVMELIRNAPTDVTVKVRVAEMAREDYGKLPQVEDPAAHLNIVPAPIGMKYLRTEWTAVGGKRIRCYVEDK